MNDAEITVDGRTLGVSTGTSLMECLVAAGLMLRLDCGGHGRCGKCLVRVSASDEARLSEPDGPEIRTVGMEKLSDGYRLACRARVRGPVSVEIPDESRLTREVGQKELPELLLRGLPVGAGQQKGLFDSWGAAVDIGTTTIAVYLCDLVRGAVVASTAVRNPQSVFGDDVVSRVSAVRTDPGMLRRLQRMAVVAVDWAMSALCRQAGIDPTRTGEMVCVGNSIMVHLFLGEDPSSIAVYPYKPAFFEARTVPAGAIGLQGNARLRTLPLVSGYLGADIVAAALAADLSHAAPGTMLVDVGTNGEIMLATREGLLATSCATGPAFEGASIRHGMQAVSGAIDSVRFSPESGRLEFTVIQRGECVVKPPTGLCGSGVISAVAELLRAGIIRKDGAFHTSGGFSCLRRDEDGIPEAVIVPAEASGSGRAVVLAQSDVRAVQLAKGALRAGIDLLCRESGLARPEKILLAGAFGSRIDRVDALRIGMFPAIAEDDIEVVGNAAGAGAVLALLREEFFTGAADLTRATRVLDLARHADFQRTFVESLSF